ncbi:hypothetical protein WJ973_12320 [Achromobacter xylosoxidans]
MLKDSRPRARVSALREARADLRHVDPGAGQGLVLPTLRNPLRVDGSAIGGRWREVAGGMIEECVSVADHQHLPLLPAVGRRHARLAVRAGQGEADVDVEAAANKLVPMVISRAGRGRAGAPDHAEGPRPRSREPAGRNRRRKPRSEDSEPRTTMNTVHLAEADAAKPWYREFWPWFLMAGPFLAVQISAITTTWPIRVPQPADPGRRGQARTGDRAGGAAADAAGCGRRSLMISGGAPWG